MLIPVLFVLFSLGGAVFGMGEEALPFTMILCPLFVAVGYDTVIAVLVTYVATQIGFGASWMNPFYCTRLWNDHVLCSESEKNTDDLGCL